MHDLSCIKLLRILTFLQLLVSLVILSINNSVLISFLTFDWKIAELIAEGHDFGRPAPVV